MPQKHPAHLSRSLSSYRFWTVEHTDLGDHSHILSYTMQRDFTHFTSRAPFTQRRPNLLCNALSSTLMPSCYFYESRGFSYKPSGRPVPLPNTRVVRPIG